MLLRPHHEEGTLYAADEGPNLSPLALEKLAALKEMGHGLHGSPRIQKKEIRANPCESVADSSLNPRETADPADLFFHALAILHAPAYREENAGALRMDWPRSTRRRIWR